MQVNPLPNKGLQTGKFHFAITGQAVGNELEIFELLHFAMSELNMSNDDIRLHWHVLLSKSVEEV